MTFAIVVADETLAEWQVRCLRQLIARPATRLGLVIVSASAEAARDAGVSRKVMERLVKPASLARRGLAAFLAEASRLTGCEILRVPLAGDDASERLVDLDFIVDLTADGAAQHLARHTRHGLWAFRFGEEAVWPAFPLFWDIARGRREMTAALVRIEAASSANQAGAPVVLKRGRFRFRHSYRATVDTVLHGVAHFPVHACNDIEARGGGGIDARAPRAAVVSPTVLDLGAFFVRVLRATLSAAYRFLFIEARWNVGVVSDPIQRFLEPGYVPSIAWLPAPPCGTFVADPFAVARADGLDLLCEQFDVRRGRGVIAHIATDGTRLRPTPVIELPVHVSYPFVIETESEVYCVPETADARRADLYRAREFPHRWERVATLLDDVAAVDSTIFRFDGRWWLFCTRKDDEPFVHLFAWHAARLTGPWHPHASNPIKTDIRTARPAGTPFVHAGALHRPSQDCLRRYGDRVWINRIIELTPQSFRETAVARVDATTFGRYSAGTHHLAAAGPHACVIDGRSERFSIGRPVRVLGAGLRRFVALRESAGGPAHAEDPARR